MFISSGVDHPSWFSAVSSKGALFLLSLSYRKPWSQLSPGLVSWHVGNPLALCFSSSSSTLSSGKPWPDNSVSHSSVLSLPFVSVFLELQPDIEGCKVYQEGRRSSKLFSITSQEPWTKGTEDLRQEEEPLTEGRAARARLQGSSVPGLTGSDLGTNTQPSSDS